MAARIGAAGAGWEQCHELLIDMRSHSRDGANFKKLSPYHSLRGAVQHTNKEEGIIISA
jgi:hypothetical protein